MDLHRPEGLMTRGASLPAASRAGNQLKNGARRGGSTVSSTASQPVASDADYGVGPGRPPRENQFKPGKSGKPLKLQRPFGRRITQGGGRGKAVVAIGVKDD